MILEIIFGIVFAGVFGVTLERIAGARKQYNRLANRVTLLESKVR